MAITALYSGLSALSAHSSMLDVVGNNIANENTTAFKAQRVTFEDLVYQTLSAGSGPSGTLGGTNPIQVGFGVRIGAIDSLFQQGPVIPTGRALDASIEGGGLFVVSTGTQTLYTRAGTFSIDAAGYLVLGSSGYRVQRFGSVGDPSPTTPGFQTPGVFDIRIPYGATLPGVPTQNVNLAGNFSSQLAIGDTVPMGIQIYDSQGTARSLNLTFTKSAADTFTVTGTVSGGTVTVPATNVVFDNTGALLSPTSLTIALNGLPAAQSITLAFNGTAGLTQFGGATTAAAVGQDGNSSGSLTDIGIDNDGRIQGVFTNGARLILAQLAIASFANPEGLIREGENLFGTGSAAGIASLGAAGTGGRGVVKGGALERSNVDLALELSRLIIAQRGFQANTRTISVANEMEAALTQIIR